MILHRGEALYFTKLYFPKRSMVTRGNVAIYCYNALTAKTWDVTESTNGELTSSKTSDTILEKYFSDFVNENGDMKLVEGAKVTMSGALTSAIGENQIRIDAENAEFEGKTSTYELANFLDVKANPKNKEEKTYGTENVVTAYVPAGVANLATLSNKTVDVIFGRNNEVAYIAVTDDAADNAVITAFNAAKRIIEIDGEEYDLADEFDVNFFGYEKRNALKDASNLESLLKGSEFGNVLKDADLTKNFLRNVVVDYTLVDDEVASLNLKFGMNYTGAVVVGEKTATMKVETYIVEKISSKDVATCWGRTDVTLDLEDELEDTRIIRNDETATYADIEVGDVVTEVRVGNDIVTLIVVSNTVEGEVTDYLAKTNKLEVAGEELTATTAPFFNEEGEVDDFGTATDADEVYELFEDETVTAYLNAFGEVVALVGEAEATGTVLGVVTETAVIDEDADDVEYLKVRILAEDGTEKRYTVYNKKAGKDIKDAAEFTGTNMGLNKNEVVRFEADADRVIKSDDIEVINVVAEAEKDDTEGKEKTEYSFKSNSGLKVYELNEVGDKTLNDKKFTSSTLVINPLEEEVFSKWEVLTNKSDDPTPVYSIISGSLKEKDGEGTVVYTDPTTKTEYIVDTAKNDNKVYLFVKGTKVVYVVASIDERVYGASDLQYGILVDVDREKDEDDETIYVATVLVDGVEETYECDESVRAFDEGSFVSFKVTDGEFKNNPTVLVDFDLVDVVADAKDDTAKIGLTSDLVKIPEVVDVVKYDANTTFNAIKVESVEVVDGETYLVFEDESSLDLANGYIVYNLANGEMVDEVNKGDYVLVVDYDTDDYVFNIVVVLN